MSLKWNKRENKDIQLKTDRDLYALDLGNKWQRNLVIPRAYFSPGGSHGSMDIIDLQSLPMLTPTHT